jgi:hypothetical protein
MEDPDKLEGLVRALSTAQGVPPVFVKIRVEMMSFIWLDHGYSNFVAVFFYRFCLRR